jgi:MiaB/RimO family radical SAM methylthiotransferase
MADAGIRELILIAQDTSQYGRDLYGKVRLPDLLRELCKIDGIEWIRLMYVYDNGITDELIETIASEPKICKYIDMPIQHVSDRVLHLMRRQSTGASIRNVINKLRERIPDVHIRTTILVGFPGETEEDFEGTLDMARRVRYDSAFTFIYSPREGTPAATFTDQIPDDVTHRRFDRLVDVMNEISLEKNLEYKGKTYDVLVEGVSKNADDAYAGRTDGFKLVNFTSEKKPEEIIGTMVRVEITESKTFSLEGREVR